MIKLPRQTYVTANQQTPVEALPFISVQADGALRWTMPIEGLDYGQQCGLGRECAAHYLQFLRSNPCCRSANFLGMLLADIHSAPKGVQAGFFTFIEQQLYDCACSIEPYVLADQESADEERMALEELMEDLAMEAAA